MPSEKIKPFLRWAGGKTWLIKNIDQLLQNIKYINYHEPFLGGASFYLALDPANVSFLSDLNEDLIKTYITLKANPDGIIQTLKTFENTEKFYYELRNKMFTDTVEQAARFIYLNQTSFNGLYRVNLNGKYNVPYGYRKKEFIESEKLYAVSKRLQNAELSYGDFDVMKDRIHKGDLVFLDPPYTVSHNHNGFIKYNQKLFSLEDQYRLSQFIDYIKQIEAYYILTNAAHEKISDIFNKGDRRIELNRSSLISGSAFSRGKISEYVFTNIGVD